MDTHYFALRLIPPRPTFAQDMNEEERGIMQRHSAYWRQLMAKGLVVVFGPVMDTAGAYGLGIVRVADAAQVQEIIAGDPANGLNRYDFHPMLAVVPG
jgi:uncharacterized protein YciI